MLSLNRLFASIKTYTSDPAVLNYLNFISFRIYKTKIITSADCASANSSLNAAERLLCNDYLDSITFLNLVSQDNYNSYCLGYTFTARDFSDGSLGIAWIASTTGAVGGICQQQATVNGVQMSLNSGIVTSVNYGARTNERSNQLTFGHEVGHSMGTNHDTTAACIPGGTAGNFIMYPRARTGAAVNNERYSICSITSMNAAVAFVAGSAKNCFQSKHRRIQNEEKKLQDNKLIKFVSLIAAPNSAICGNGVVDTGEQCDFAADSTCCTSSCRLVAGAACSPSLGACCSSTCTIKPSNTSCLSGTTCRGDIFCDGVSASCPVNVTSGNRPNLTPCNSGTQVCLNGVKILSLRSHTLIFD